MTKKKSKGKSKSKGKGKGKGKSESERRKVAVPRLRFSGFSGDLEWSKKTLNDLVSTVTPSRKIKKSEYLEQGKYPIIDQSKASICGWTNDENSLVKESLPLIIFGDHTCILKLISEPFAQGADGVKILKTNENISPMFLYQNLQSTPVNMEEYKRHFSILKEKVIFFSIKREEQKKIADCLSSLDDLINAQVQKIEVLQEYKKGLLQQLFPQRGGVGAKVEVSWV